MTDKNHQYFVSRALAIAFFNIEYKQCYNLSAYKIAKDCLVNIITRAMQFFSTITWDGRFVGLPKLQNVGRTVRPFTRNQMSDEIYKRMNERRMKWTKNNIKQYIIDNTYILIN